MSSIPNAFWDLFERKTIAHAATLMPDQMPHVTPVWIDYDADSDRLLLNTARGRQKLINLQNDPRIGLSMTDPDDPYRSLSILGEVDEMTDEGAAEHMDSLERRYRGNDEFQGDRTDRILLKIRPRTVWSWDQPPHYSVD